MLRVITKNQNYRFLREIDFYNLFMLNNKVKIKIKRICLRLIIQFIDSYLTLTFGNLKNNFTTKTKYQI